MEAAKRYLYYLLFLTILFSCIRTKKTTTIPMLSNQMLLVITDSTKAIKGNLFCFGRDNGKAWKISKSAIPVVIGRSGLGWGAGIHKETEIPGFPQKMEGDGRSPAGIFSISTTFGFASEEQTKGLKMPYIPISEMIECVDDVKSEYYNRIVSTEDVDSVDWQSSEKMDTINLYKLGIVVDHNTASVKKGGGSCIFLHIWRGPELSTSGCTAMDSTAIKDVVYWLDKSKNPILIQLTKELYHHLKREWKLPKIRCFLISL
jgi:L,D-peptidoglycan transpeptidase YkuD (ErfK/YbiS/YcfS/YnhG family)